MTPTEERLRAALAARADLYDGSREAPPAPTETWWHRWRGPVAIAVAAAVVVAAGIGVAFGLTGGRRVQPAPAPATPGTPTTPSATVPAGVTLSGDVDGDGVPDTVTTQGRVLTAELSGGGTAELRLARGERPSGLADVGGDRLLLVAGVSAYRLGDGGSFRVVATSWFPPSLVWVDDDARLLTGVRHEVDGEEYLTAYAWTGRGTELTPAADRMHCPGGEGSVPTPCGDGATFVGEVGDLPELQPAPVDTVGVGDGEVVSQGAGIDGLTARLEGSTEPEVGDGDVELVVGGARYGLPAGGAPALLQASFPAGDGVAFAVTRSFGDSTAYDVYRYDGSGIEPVTVEAVRGLDLHGGGPAAGGPFTDVFLSGSGGFVTLRSQSGIDLYQDAVQWRLEGDRMVGTDLGTVCLDTLVDALDVPGAYGDCGLG
ncbi:hypothetical protein [Nocardioides sp. YIM 152588]|uniref:hypothetical protein n=1 Tax=Nocardioides sp. YIM 152588 TaxID=3158259 RepID=UPI0032E42F1E